MTLAATQQAKLDAALRYGAGIKGPFIVASAPAPELPLLVAAVEYAGRGWHVLPLHSPTQGGCSCGRADCSSVGKHPRTRSGLKEASRDLAVIRAWWKRWPDANIGVATGPESGLLVLDVDGKAGEDSLIELERCNGALPATFSVKTGKGQHIYFAYPDGLDIRNSAGKIAPGLDIRGAGGYVVGAGSQHISGARYEVTESATDPAPCPEGLLSLIQSANGAQAGQSAPATVGTATIRKGGGEPEKLKMAWEMFSKGRSVDVVLAAVLQMDRECEHKRGESDCRDRVNRWYEDFIKKGGKNGKPLAEGKSASIEPDLITLSDVAPRMVDWLWPPRIALGMVNELVGDTGVGKTTIAMHLAAEGSRGRLPEGGTIESFDTLYLSHENPLAEVLRPKFDAMHGDPKRFHVMLGTKTEVDGETHKGSVTLADVDQLEKAIRQTGAKLVVFDPVQSFFGAGVDWNHANQTRPILDALNKLADKTRAAILLLRHGTKASGGKATAKGLGSIDQTATARSSLLAGVLPDDEKMCALIHSKTNIGPKAPTLGYAIDEQGRFTWTGVSSITAAELLASPEAPDRKLTAATQWLTEKLQRGSLEAQEISKAAEAAGISWRTLQRAKSALRVQSRRATFAGGSIWSLPEDSPKDGRFEA
jgi:hypothetical protein